MGRRCDCSCGYYSVYLWTFAVAFVSCVFGIVALTSPTWLEGRYGSQEYLLAGLLVFCHHNNTTPDDQRCAPLLLAGEGWFDAARLLGILAILFQFTILVMSILLHFVDHYRIFSLHLLILGIFACITGIIAAIVFGVCWILPEKNDLVNNSRNYSFDLTLSWGYIVFVVGQGVTLFLFILQCILARDICVLRLYTFCLVLKLTSCYSLEANQVLHQISSLHQNNNCSNSQ